MTAADKVKFREEAIRHTLGIEGGYVDDPRDSGGKTRWGITVAVARRNGWKGKMCDLPPEKAVEIYRKKYWAAARCDDLPPSVAVRVFDAAVNHGVGGAGRLLQMAINSASEWALLVGAYGSPPKYRPLKVDGAVGPKTMRLFRRIYKCDRAFVGAEDHRKVFHVAWAEARNSLYLQLIGRRNKDAVFARGWEKRVDEMTRYAMEVFRRREC